MKYEVVIRYKDGTVKRWHISDHKTAIFIFVSEVKRYRKQIRSGYMKGVRV